MSYDPDASLLSLGGNTTLLTGPNGPQVSAPLVQWRHSTPAQSHYMIPMPACSYRVRTLRSRPSPNGPRASCLTCPVATFHTRTVLSYDPDASLLPSGENNSIPIIGAAGSDRSLCKPLGRFGGHPSSLVRVLAKLDPRSGDLQAGHLQLQEAGDRQLRAARSHPSSLTHHK